MFAVRSAGASSPVPDGCLPGASAPSCSHLSLAMQSRRPRIGLNLLFLRPGAIGGGETYSRGLLQGFIQTRPAFDFVLFLNRAAWPTFDWIDSTPGFARVLCNVPLHPWLRHVWEQLNFSRLCRRHDIDLLHSLGNVVPFFAPCPQVVTIHDLLYKRS